LKPREQWRAGMTSAKLVDELDCSVKVPGLSNIWVPPMSARAAPVSTPRALAQAPGNGERHMLRMQDHEKTAGHLNVK